MKLGEVLEELCQWRRDGGYSYLEDEKSFRMWVLGTHPEVGKKKFFRDFIAHYEDSIWDELKELEVANIDKSIEKKSMKVIVIGLGEAMNKIVR